MPKMPISPAKRATNRANAQKSTGPRTPEGKAVSSRNATRHGLLARSLILRDDPVESESAFRILLNALIDQFQPQGSFESLLVERIAVCYWRLARAARFETRSILDDRRDEYAPWMEIQRAVNGRPADPARHIIPVTHDLDALIRYEGLIDRELHRTLAQFHRFRTQRLTAESALAQSPTQESPSAPETGEPLPGSEKTMPIEPTGTAFLSAPAPIRSPEP